MDLLIFLAISFILGFMVGIVLIGKMTALVKQLIKAETPLKSAMMPHSFGMKTMIILQKRKNNYEEIQNQY